MSTEQQQGLHELSIVDLKEFLDKPFKQIEVRRLVSSPDLPLLRWLPTLTDEVGFVLQHPTWYVIKASDMGIPNWVMPSNSDALLHSHPIDEDEQENDGSIPSIPDFLNCSPIARNFIISFSGLTQYWQVEDEEAKRTLRAALYSGRYGSGSKKHYLPFLQDIEARYERHMWDEISEQKLNELFTGL